MRKGGRVAEGARLESVYRDKTLSGVRIPPLPPALLITTDYHRIL